jgi:hypothetical protein
VAANPVLIALRMTVRECEVLDEIARKLPLSRKKFSRSQAVRWLIDEHDRRQSKVIAHTVRKAG